jgi:hypothetical protein
MDRCSDDDGWTVEQGAECWGVSTSWWRALVSRTRAGRPGGAPLPLPGYDPHTGRLRWDPQEVREAKERRLGQGYRSDLHQTD